MLSSLLAALKGAALEDVIVTGFWLDDERPIRFRPLYRVIYFEFDRLKLKFAVVDDTARMKVSPVDEVTVEPDPDDSMKPACSSISQTVLLDPDASNRLASVRLLGVREEINGVECAAASFDLVNGQRIFVDPSYHFGIRIGGHEQQRIWHENWSERECVETDLRR